MFWFFLVVGGSLGRTGGSARVGPSGRASLTFGFAVMSAAGIVIVILTASRLSSPNSDATCPTLPKGGIAKSRARSRSRRRNHRREPCDQVNSQGAGERQIHYLGLDQH